MCMLESAQPMFIYAAFDENIATVKVISEKKITH